MVDQHSRRKNFSITTYMIVAIICIHMLVLPVLYLTITNGYKDSLYEQFVSHVTEVSGLLADVLSTKSLEQDREDIINILETSILGGNIQFVEIIDQQGKIILPHDDVTSSSNKFKEDDAVNQNADDTYYLSMPVYFSENKDEAFSLRVGVDESAIINDYYAIRKKIIYVFVTYLLAVVIFFAAITRIIHKPLYQLRDRSREIASGNTDMPLELTTRFSEIQFLADDLDEMRLSLVSLADRMQYKATHDELTNLPNRYLFNDRLQYAISVSARDKKKFSILLLDLNRFKEINDTLGHGVGDEVLIIVSQRMLEGLRDSDTVARIGGDEFSFILTGVDQILAEKMAKKIIDIIEPTFEVDNHTLKIGASIGISVFPDNGEDGDLLMRRADVAMYNAKHNGLPLASYHTEMDSCHYENLMMANDLKNSIVRGHFEPLLQPKIDMLTNQPCGCEILLRWHHPNLGLVYPDKFIPIAEQENLIGELTSWVIRNYGHKFDDLGKTVKDFHISINVSPIDLLNRDLFESIHEILQNHQFPTSQLYIEVTENAIMKNPHRSADILASFHDAGIMVSIDDFGTGYSSLAYLQKFPISELKIDKSFISDLTEDSANFAIVNATITMAHDLGILVVAEGVEDKAVLDLLNSMGCDRVQGFLYAKAMSFSDMLEWLKSYKVI